MTDSTLTLCFLAQRDYLHGTTLFDALAPWYAGGTDLHFKIARMCRTDRVAVEDAPPGASFDASRYAATLFWKRDSGERRLGILPLDPSASPPRMRFDEEAIVARATWNGLSATLVGQHDESFVRSVVALNKALLFRELAPPPPGQWLFTRLDLARPVGQFDRLRLIYRSQVGLAAVSTAIEADGTDIGTVMFSWLKR